jgi:hypothetical protein
MMAAGCPAAARMTVVSLRVARAQFILANCPPESASMRVTTMSQMWRLLDTYTLTPEGTERAVNHNNEWGGYSRRLRMPVFTGWLDFTTFEKEL